MSNRSVKIIFIFVIFLVVTSCVIRGIRGANGNKMSKEVQQTSADNGNNLNQENANPSGDQNQNGRQMNPSDSATRGGNVNMNVDNSNNNEMSVATQQPKAKKDATLFYSSTCPHCMKVEDYLKSNPVSDKINLDQKEISDNANAQQLLEKATSCGISNSNIGVPMLYVDDKCIVGNTDIINYFKSL